MFIFVSYVEVDDANIIIYFYFPIIFDKIFFVMAHSTEEINRNIRLALGGMGVTMTQAAARLGIAPQNLNRMLKGPLSRKSAELFASTFGFDINYMLTGDGSLVPEKGQDTQHVGDGIFVSREKLVEWLDNLTEAVSIQAQMLERRQDALIHTDKDRKYLAHK